MVKMILWIARCQYQRFWNLKNIFIMLCSVVFLGESVFKNIGIVAQQTGLGLNYLEPVILVMSTAFYAIVIPITCLVLLADFPDNSSHGVFMMMRVTRRSWLLGQLLYAAFLCLTYFLILLIGSAVWTGRNGVFGTQWGSLMTEIRDLAPEVFANNADVILSNSTITQGTLFGVLGISVGLMLLYMITFSQILCVFKLIGKKRIGLIFCIALTIAGAAVTSVGGNVKWILPMAHAIFGLHFDEFFAAPLFRLSWSVLYFIICNILLGILNNHLVQRCQIGDEKA